MLFGTKESFAFEAYLNQRGDYVFINCCFWVKNQMIGVLEDETLLTSVIPILDLSLSLQGQRYFSELDTYNDFEILTYFIYNLWSDDQVSSAIQTQYSRQDLKKADISSQQGETFQGFYTFLIERNTYDLFLCSENALKNPIAAKIPKSIFYKTIKQALDWIKHSTVLVLRTT